LRNEIVVLRRTYPRLRLDWTDRSLRRTGPAPDLVSGTRENGEVGSITHERIMQVRRHVTDALVRTSENSTLSLSDQHHVLGQACAETCDLLTDWLASDGWGRLQQRSLRQVGDAFYDAAGFLDQPLAELLSQVNEQMAIATAEQLIRQAHDAVHTVSRRCPHWRQAELFAEAESRLGDLRGEICALMAELRTSPATPAARARVHTLLRRAVAVIPTLALAMPARAQPKWSRISRHGSMTRPV
jgi:hypothetical protein